MNWLRNRLRAWLGISDPTNMVPFAQSLVNLEKTSKLNTSGISALMAELSRSNGAIVDELEALKKLPTLADVSRKQFEIDTAIRELKEMRDQMLDPKRVPIRTRNGSQMRQLMEQEP